MNPPICKVCGGYCYPSTAIKNQDLRTLPDEAGNSTVYEQAGPPVLQDVQKCEDCGHSFTSSIQSQVAHSFEQKAKNFVDEEILNSPYKLVSTFGLTMEEAGKALNKILPKGL